MRTHKLHPFGPEYVKRNAHQYVDDRCAHCGRTVRKPLQYLVEVIDGGGAYVRGDTPDMATRRCQNDYMGYFPVGPDCAKRLRTDGVVVVESKEGI